MKISRNKEESKMTLTDTSNTDYLPVNSEIMKLITKRKEYVVQTKF